MIFKTDINLVIKQFATRVVRCCCPANAWRGGMQDLVSFALTQQLCCQINLLKTAMHEAFFWKIENDFQKIPQKL
jgi:hypothetical protein